MPLRYAVGDTYHPHSTTPISSARDKVRPGSKNAARRRKIKTELEAGIAPVAPAVGTKRVVVDRRRGEADGFARSRLPNRVTAHPGEVLREEFLKPPGLSVNGLAAALRVPTTRIGAIIKGERSVTPNTALGLAPFFGKVENSGSTCRPCTTSPARASKSGPMIERDISPRSNWPTSNDSPAT
jgi:addiction module HigA family antidote